jgi:acetyl-CoA carboxylase biotin carboxyl carrier protein
MDLQLIKKLIKLLEDSSLGELSVEKDGFAISLKKTSLAPASVMPLTDSSRALQSASTPAREDSHSSGVPVTSPMVGTFYHASAPDKPPYVRVGERVSKGSTIGIIEAMKMMNMIPSPISGRVEKICVDNGSAVEFGQTLVIIARD